MNGYHPAVPRKFSLLDCFGCCLGTDESHGNDLEPLTRGGLGGFREQQLNDTLTMDLARTQQSRRALYSKLGHLHDFSIEDIDGKVSTWPVLPHPRFRYALERPTARPCRAAVTRSTHPLDTSHFDQAYPPRRLQDDDYSLGWPQRPV